jgi:OFA family oxalate/formate antiporter-like MFS transporter
MSFLENKWFRAAIPALFIHSCIGSVYCWSLLKGEIATEIGCSVSAIEFAFSLAIFFLGMSAAFGGRFVEKNVKLSSLISLFCFVSGLFLSVLSIVNHSVTGLMLSYGCLMGIGLGIGYLSPVKTLMLWFKEHKGLATGIAISGFGLSKVLFSPFITWCNENYGVCATLTYMAIISIFFMSIAAWLIHKPKDWIEPKDKFSISESWHIITNPTYLMIWFIFYINITCGLALIAFEKNIGLAVGITSVGLLASLTALFNTLGRFFYSTASDLLKQKEIIYIIIFTSSVVAMLMGLTWMYVIPTAIMLCVINAGYGGGFSTLPTLLQSKFGMDKISTIHGFALSAWAWAGLSGNQLSNLIINRLQLSYIDLFTVLGCLYFISLLVTYTIYKNGRVCRV